MDYPCAKFLAILVLTVLVLSCEHTDRQTESQNHYTEVDGRRE